MEGNGKHIEQLRAPHHRETWELLDHFTIETEEGQGVEHPKRAICKICRQIISPAARCNEMLEFQRHSEECKEEMERMEAKLDARQRQVLTLENVHYDVQ